MRILFVAARFPLPPHTGAKIRTLYLLRAAAQKHEVVFVAPISLEPERAAREMLARMLPGLVVRTDDRPDTARTPARLAVDAVRNLTQALPLTWMPYQADSLASVIREEVARHRFDLVHCDHVHVAPIVPRSATCPLVVDAHNVESVMATRLWRAERKILRQAALRWQAAKIERAERAIFARSDAGLACSDHDAALVRAMAPGADIRTIPNGVDLEYFRTPSSEDGHPPKLVFIGSLDWSPNEDALQYFVGEIWPLVRTDWPALTLEIAGRDPSALVRGLAGNGVTVRGTVDDIRPLLSSATAVIVPLRAGSGTRLKILEAWAMEKPVVSTSLGAEGLAVAHGENILLANSPTDFRIFIGSLLRDRALRARLGSAGRRLVEQQYGWDGIGRQLLATYEDVVVRREAR